MYCDYEESQKKMADLLDWESKINANNRNEAATRLHLIDEIFFKCLGWIKTDCYPEEAYEGTYTDYSFGFPARSMVVEAKKEGIYFELPVGLGKKVCNIGTITEGNKPVEEAIKQCLKYCQERGIAIGAVCNGWQLVAFIGSRVDGVPPMDGKALVFSSLKDMADNFRLLWDNLSQNGVKSCNLLATLKAQTFRPPPPKLSHTLLPYPGLKNRNPLQTQLKMLADLYLEDVMKHPDIEMDFLSECYCQGGALSQYAMISKQILETRYSLMLEKESALEKVNYKSGLSAHLSADILQASLSKRPIILLGDVGVGKSTFLRHFLQIDAKEILRNAVSIYVDFGREPALTDDLNRHVIDSCEEQLYQGYGIDILENNFVKGVYHSELKRFEKGIYASLRETNPGEFKSKELLFLEAKMQNRPTHLQHCFDHINKGHKRQIVLMLDNLDQRPLEFQEKAFLVAESLADKWPVTVFISLRPETFYRSKSRGTLTAYQTRVFTISPPRVDLVIFKRLQFALKQLRASHSKGTAPLVSEFQSKDLENYFHALIHSFEVSEDLKQLIDNLSHGNIRAALEILNAFIGSGHVDTVKILNALKESGRYLIPIHEFIRAVLFGDYEHYAPESSTPIANLFDISTPDGREHFLLPIILAQIEQLGVAGAHGFVEALKIFSYCQSLGYQPNQIQVALDRACEKKLLENSPKFESDQGVAEYRITTVGAYHHKKVVEMFTYINAMIVDTPIVDLHVQGMLFDARLINDRLDQTEIFCDYLDKQWAQLKKTSPAFDWEKYSQIIKANILNVRERIAAKKMTPAVSHENQLNGREQKLPSVPKGIA